MVKLAKELRKTSVDILLDPFSIRKVSAPILERLVNEWEALQKHKRLLEDLEKPKILVVGDIHGDLEQLQKALYFLETDQVDHVILNGDLIDRGPDMIECICLVMAYNLMFPDRLTYLRGNHELMATNSVYGFRGYATGLFGTKIYESFSRIFQQLPLAMKIGDWGFITHGGIPKDQIFFHMMRLEVKPKEPASGSYYELIWNDPLESINGFSKSKRGVNIHNFGRTAFDEFMSFHNLDFFIRAHQAFNPGYKWFFDHQLLSLFSSKAGPYHQKDPHFALLANKDIELIAASSVELD